jgi:hypothetical protein
MLETDKCMLKTADAVTDCDENNKMPFAQQAISSIAAGSSVPNRATD